MKSCGWTDFALGGTLHALKMAIQLLNTQILGYGIIKYKNNQVIIILKS